MSATGTAILNFGAAPGADNTLVAVSDVNVQAGSNIEAWFMYDSTSDHTANDHAYAATLMTLLCGTVTVGVGFNIYAVASQFMQGTYQVRWVWV